MNAGIASLILIGAFFLLITLRTPVALSLGLSAVFAALYMEVPLIVIAQKMVDGINKFSLISIPFFILAGEIMSSGGISDRLIDFANVFVGRLRGGLAQVNIVASMFFGGINGSSTADVSSIGSVMIPMMEKNGYDKDYSVNVTITSSVQGILIPPSHNMIIYSLAAGGSVSIGKLFLGGVVPGVFLGISLMILSYLIAVRRNYPRGRTHTFREALKISGNSFLGLMTALIILGGIISGVFTATEASAFAVVYAFIISKFVYRRLKWKDVIPLLGRCIHMLAIIITLVACSSAFGYMLALLRVPKLVADTLLSLTSNRYVILLIVNLVLLLLGMIMDMVPIILMATPIFLPVVTAVGMDPVQFGIVLMLNLGIGLLTPPVGSSLFVGCSIANIPVEKIARSILPFYGVMFFCLLVVTYIPVITLYLPRLIK